MKTAAHVDATEHYQVKPHAAIGHHYEIGPYRVAIRSCHPKVINDFDTLYSHLRTCRVSDDESQERQTVNIDIVPQRSGLTLHKRYRFLGDGNERLYSYVPANSLLPHLEWAINQEVTRKSGQYLQLHAASLAFQDQGVLLTAKSSCGKSTLAAMLLARGWQYYCDEMSLVNVHTQHLHAFPKAICLKEGAVKLAERYGLELNCRNYYAIAFKGYVAYINPVRINSRAISEPRPLKHIFLPQYVPGQTRPELREVSRAQVVLDLAENLFNKNMFGDETINYLGRIVRNASCYRIFTGDIEKTCELLESTILTGTDPSH